MEEINAGQKWAITDGSAGLRGQVLKTDDMAEIKLFAATAISGLAQGLQTTTVSPLTGAIISTGSLKNGLRQGASAVADKYAQMILDTIERDGYFVRVPASSRGNHLTQPQPQLGIGALWRYRQGLPGRTVYRSK